MTEPKPLIQNAANEEQVKHAKAREKTGREREINDIRQLLQSPHGRRFIWRLLDHCSVFRSIWHPSAQIHCNAGRQDVGHFIMAEVTAANEDAFLQMMKEAKQGDL